MNNGLKGLFLSSLVWPGLGQFVLKQKVRGIVVMAVTFLFFCVVLVRMTQKVMVITASIQEQVGHISISAIISEWVALSSAYDTLFYAVLMLCWVGGSIDAYLAGTRRDNELEERGKQ